MVQARREQTATRLGDGRVLLAGGQADGRQESPVIASAEIYDPVSGTFAPTGQLSEPRYGAVATLLLDGRVLVAGGRNAYAALNTAEIWQP
jgi:hypothetical protein